MPLLPRPPAPAHLTRPSKCGVNTDRPFIARTIVPPSAHPVSKAQAPSAGRTGTEALTVMRGSAR